MSWLSNFVLPKIRAVVAKKEVPDNLWDKCPKCEQMLFHRELEQNLYVCHSCGHHMRLAEHFAPGALEKLVQPMQGERVGAVSGNTKVANRRRLLGRGQHLEYTMANSRSFFI